MRLSPGLCKAHQDPGQWAFSNWASLPVLCLVHGILTRQGSLSQPSISAEPGSVISRGRNVTILCQANGGFELFRLEKCSPGNGPTFKDEKNTSSFQKEARFAFTLMNPGCYVCIYQKSSTWSPRSEKLNLTVADADVTQASIPTASAVASGLSPFIWTISQLPSSVSHPLLLTPSLSPSQLTCTLGLPALSFLNCCFHSIPAQSGHGAGLAGWIGSGPQIWQSDPLQWTVFPLGIVCSISFQGDGTSGAPRNMSSLVWSLSDTIQVSWSKGALDQVGMVIW